MYVEPHATLRRTAADPLRTSAYWGDTENLPCLDDTTPPEPRHLTFRMTFRSTTPAAGPGDAGASALTTGAARRRAGRPHRPGSSARRARVGPGTRAGP
jgi:hypothetical protein